MGWGLLKNGELLAAAESEGFDVFLTGDKNVSYQQNLEDRRLALVVLGTTQWKELRQDTAPVAAAVDREHPEVARSCLSPRPRRAVGLVALVRNPD